MIRLSLAAVMACAALGLVVVGCASKRAPRDGHSSLRGLSLPKTYPQRTSSPPWTAYYVDAEGSHLLDLSVDVERAEFEAVCLQWVDGAEACDTRRLTSLRPDAGGRLGPDLRRWPLGARPMREPMTVTLVLIPGGTSPAHVMPAYPAEHARHRPYQLGPGASGARLYALTAVLVPRWHNRSGHLVMQLALDPWDRGVVERLLVGESAH